MTMAKEQASFSGGTWPRAVQGGGGRGVLPLGSEEAARAAAEEIRSQGPPPGVPVTLERVDAYEVLARASPTLDSGLARSRRRGRIGWVPSGARSPAAKGASMTREQATEAIRAAREERGLTWHELAEATGRSPVWTTAALLGQGTMSAKEAASATKALGLGPDVGGALQRPPTKGSLEAAVPVDPLIYRFHEITQVYGTTIKELIHEEFGDGIMSAIDFEMRIERRPDPKGDRVVVTFDGKFLPYRVW